MLSARRFRSGTTRTTTKSDLKRKRSFHKGTVAQGVPSVSRKIGFAYVGMLLAFSMLGAATAPASFGQTSAVTAKKFTNADLLKWPQRDQQLWAAGAIEGIANTVILTKPDAGRCVLKWYGDGATKFAVFLESAKLYPTSEPIVVLITLANRSCKFSN